MVYETTECREADRLPKSDLHLIVVGGEHRSKGLLVEAMPSVMKVFDRSITLGATRGGQA